jgi:Questin oxidase-like
MHWRPRWRFEMKTLIELLDQSLAFDAEYQSKLSNHLPMLLAALQRLGASDAQLTAALQRYSAQLQAMPALQAWPLGDPWKAPLGQPLAWPRYRDLFAMWLREEGAGAVLHQTLPALLPGCGAAAFHGLIRTAYAVETAHSAEIAHALAYWACRWLDLGLAVDAAPSGGTVADPATLVGLATKQATKQGAKQGAKQDAKHAAKGAAAGPDATGAASPYIVERMHHSAHSLGFAATVQPLRLDADTLHRLARHAAQSYARSGSFTVLHLVTSAWAMRVLLPFTDHVPAAVGCYWQAYAAAAVSESPRLKLDAAAPKPRPWPELVQAALHSQDEHLVKLVDACRQEQSAWGGANDWQLAATRAVAGR